MRRQQQQQRQVSSQSGGGGASDKSNGSISAKKQYKIERAQKVQALLDVSSQVASYMDEQVKNEGDHGCIEPGAFAEAFQNHLKVIQKKASSSYDGIGSENNDGGSVAGEGVDTDDDEGAIVPHASFKNRPDGNPYDPSQNPFHPDQNGTYEVYTQHEWKGTLKEFAVNPKAAICTVRSSNLGKDHRQIVKYSQVCEVYNSSPVFIDFKFDNLPTTVTILSQYDRDPGSVCFSVSPNRVPAVNPKEVIFDNQQEMPHIENLSEHLHFHGTTPRDIKESICSPIALLGDDFKNDKAMTERLVSMGTDWTFLKRNSILARYIEFNHQQFLNNQSTFTHIQDLTPDHILVLKEDATTMSSNFLKSIKSSPFQSLGELRCRISRHDGEAWDSKVGLSEMEWKSATTHPQTVLLKVRHLVQAVYINDENDDDGGDYDNDNGVGDEMDDMGA